jgi:hypothetical protein
VVAGVAILRVPKTGTGVGRRKQMVLITIRLEFRVSGVFQIAR